MRSAFSSKQSLDLRGIRQMAINQARSEISGNLSVNSAHGLGDRTLKNHLPQTIPQG